MLGARASRAGWAQAGVWWQQWGHSSRSSPSKQEQNGNGERLGMRGAVQCSGVQWGTHCPTTPWGCHRTPRSRQSPARSPQPVVLPTQPGSQPQTPVPNGDTKRPAGPGVLTLQRDATARDTGHRARPFPLLTHVCRVPAAAWPAIAAAAAAAAGWQMLRPPLVSPRCRAEPGAVSGG